jgi:hypothetical protein
MQKRFVLPLTLMVKYLEEGSSAEMKAGVSNFYLIVIPQLNIIQGLTQKSLQRLFPCDTSMVVIIDDRADVWEWSPNLIKVIPCSCRCCSIMP